MRWISSGRRARTQRFRPQVSANSTRIWRRHPELSRAKMVIRRKRSDRKSTRLNSSHGYISYAVFCLKKKKLPARDTALPVAADGTRPPTQNVVVNTHEPALSKA